MSDVNAETGDKPEVAPADNASIQPESPAAVGDEQPAGAPGNLPDSSNGTPPESQLSANTSNEAGSATSLDGEQASAAPLTLRERVALQAQAAGEAGMTDESNVLSWIHNHLMGARRVIEGCGEFHISDDGQALIAEIAVLL